MIYNKNTINYLLKKLKILKKLLILLWPLNNKWLSKNELLRDFFKSNSKKLISFSIEIYTIKPFHKHNWPSATYWQLFYFWACWLSFYCFVFFKNKDWWKRIIKMICIQLKPSEIITDTYLIFNYNYFVNLF